MFTFNYYTPTEIIFGQNTEIKTAELIKKYGGSKILIHYGSQRIVKNGLLSKITKQLDSQNLFHVELGGVVPNPRLSLVYEGIKLVKNEKIDFILAIGGGSVIDSAKAITYGATTEGDVWDFYCGKRKPSASLPLGTILTLAATGSEMSDSSVITNETGWLKRGCNSNLCRPKFSILNPDFTKTLPDYQTACGCTDIMMHTMERYFCNCQNMQITDSLAEALMRTVYENSLILKDDPQNDKARAEIMWAGSLSHNGLTGCGTDGGDWMTHKLEHELGALYDVAHGAGLAAIWPSWARYVYKDCLHRFKQFALNVMNIENKGNDEEIAEKGIKAVEDFYRAIKMPINLKELNITIKEGDLELMAQKCAAGVNGGKGSAKFLKEEDMLTIYRMAAASFVFF